jgi:hypothetical protein
MRDVLDWLRGLDLHQRPLGYEFLNHIIQKTYHDGLETGNIFAVLKLDRSRSFADQATDNAAVQVNVEWFVTAVPPH